MRQSMWSVITCIVCSLQLCPIHAVRLYDCRESILNLVSYSRYLRSEDRQSGGGRAGGAPAAAGRTPFVGSEYWGRYKSAIECATARGVIGERDGLRRQKRTERGEGYSGEFLCAAREPEIKRSQLLNVLIPLTATRHSLSLVRTSSNNCGLWRGKVQWPRRRRSEDEEGDGHLPPSYCRPLSYRRRGWGGSAAGCWVSQIGSICGFPN